MKLKGFLIPGLSMEKSELPQIDGLLQLQNAEVGDGPAFPETYTVADLAELHLKTIKAMASSSSTIHIVGMSLGGMIVSVLAGHFRNQLPPNCRFYFMVTSANTATTRSLDRQMLSDWKSVRPGDIDDMKRILSPFFSPTFLKNNPEKAQAYFEYRARGGNRQTAKAFMKQVSAVLSYNGEDFYPKIDPGEGTFIHAASDLIFGQKHVDDLRRLAPLASHQLIDGVGHMVNIERPELFDVG